MEYFRSKKHIENANKARLLALEKIAKNKKERINNYYINSNKCIFCKKTLEYEKKNRKFCNSSCAASFNNKKRILSDETKKLIGEKLRGRKQTEERKNKTSGDKNGSQKNGEYLKNSEIKSCIVCGIEFKPKEISKGRYGRSKCCSKECQDKQSSILMKEKANQGLLNGWSTRNIISYPEQFFITVLKNNNIEFKHNHPVDKRKLGLNNACNYFLDFFIEDKNIDLEIDGKQHRSRQEHDDFRDKILIENGYVVYRIKWKNINTNNGKIYMKNEIDKFLKFYNNN